MSEPSRLRDTAKLPADYRHRLTIDFKKDKKLALAIQVIFVLIALLAVAAALVTDLLPATSWSPVLTIAVTVVACLVYMALHEATHGVALQLLTKVKPSYAVRFPFLTTGNHAYLTRRSAVIVALVPAVLWAIVLVVALVTLPPDYLLSTYVLLALNFAGSSGDFVEVYVVSKEPHDALFKDDGNQLHVFVPGLSS